MGPSILKYFNYEHLPERLQLVSKPFHDLAHLMMKIIPVDDCEMMVGLRKLLEAKDCAVRAMIKD